MEGACGTGHGTAVLCSAGLDSLVLLAHEARRGPVVPVYVSAGLAWEPAERRALEIALSDDAFRDVGPVQHLSFPVRDVYPPSHWAIRGTPPAYDTPDEDVYLTGRNLALLTRTGMFCAQRGLGRIALGPLAGNPFPDATPAFFDAMARALSLGLAHDVEVVAPFSTLHKWEVIRMGLALDVPLERSLSCMDPQELAHCGRCSKCRERHDAFAEAGVEDPTRYAVPPPR